MKEFDYEDLLGEQFKDLSREDKEMMYSILKKVLRFSPKELLEDQKQRYISVLNANRAYMESRGMKLPSEFIDFFHWFRYKCSKNGDDPLLRKIQDSDLEEYHLWKMEQNKAPATSVKKHPSVRICALCLAIAYQSKKIDEEHSGKAAIIALSQELFPFYNPAGVYDDWRLYKLNKLEKLKSHPEFEVAFELYTLHFA